jgi:hypothetical protein
MQVDLNKIWQNLESTTSKQVVRKRVSFITDLKCFVGIIGFTGAKMFQLEMGLFFEY